MIAPAAAADNIRWLVAGPGARLARLCFLQGRAERTRAGRLQICLEVAGSKHDPQGRYSRPQWFDAALVYDTRDAAASARHKAQAHADKAVITIQQAAIELSRGLV
jgi:hypothetical protein